MRTGLAILLSMMPLLLTARGATAQTAGQQVQAAIFDLVCSGTTETIGGNHLRCTSGMQFESGDASIYADEGDYYPDEGRAVVSGNVVLTQGENRITADSAELNLRDTVGTFYNAFGFASVKESTQSSRPGSPRTASLGGDQTEVYFYGEVVEKLGPRKYRITNGGFTTCVQPTPRWDLTAGSVTLNIDSYTFLRNAVFHVKGVPLLYIPAIYYPTKEDGRATGILIPTYGTSTLRGQMISNAFFWAIDRSQDATIMHDWFSGGAQGTGGEYRYTLGTGNGDLRAHMLNESQLVTDTGSVLPASRSYDIRGGANQVLPRGLRARARVDYFSSVQTMQTFSTDVYEASRSQRSFGGNVVGAWGSYSLNGTFDRNEYFYDATNSVVSGNGPRIAISRSERPLFSGAPVYVGVSGDYARLVRERRASGVVEDSGLNRIDVTPRIRYPFKRFSFFTINSSLSWRETHYSRSLSPDTGKIVDDDVSRRFFTFQAHAIGPVFTRVWDTPDSGYAERFKHSIEPFVNLSRTSAIDNFDRIVQVDGTDTILGGSTRLGYGLNNRFYAKRRVGTVSQAQEIVFVELSQTYYTDERAAQYDSQYSTSFGRSAPSKFSPVQLSVRGTPTSDFSTTMRAEFDVEHRQFRTFAVNGTYDLSGLVQASGGWSRTFFIEELRGFDNPDFLDHYLNANTTIRTRDGHFGGAYAFNYDVLRSSLLQQRISGFYNAQCCGLAFEYQTFNFGGINTVGVPSDRRFFLSFTLAGIGNFSPMNGAMGNVPR